MIDASYQGGCHVVKYQLPYREGVWCCTNIFFFPSPWKRRRNWGLAASHHTQYDPERSNWTQKCSGLLFRSCTEIIKPIINFHLLGLWPQSESQIAISASSSITQCHSITDNCDDKNFYFPSEEENTPRTLTTTVEAKHIHSQIRHSIVSRSHWKRFSWLKTKQNQINEIPPQHKRKLTVY